MTSTIDMTARDITTERLHRQQLTQHAYSTVGALVAWMGAAQAQDYRGALWALGQRLPNTTATDVERAVADGDIIRTHVMRPTWHFVAPADLRWMQHLTAPRVRRTLGYYDRQLELDAKTIAKASRIVERALSGGHALTRKELERSLNDGGVMSAGQRTGHLLMHAELNAEICSGPRRGKQSTHTLVGERIPVAPRLTRDEALAELTRRYFTSHGPASLQDFAWWSGLTVADARRGIEALGSEVRRISSGDRTLWLYGEPAATSRRRGGAFLLPNYDEYGIAYKDRSDLLPATQRTEGMDTRFPHFFVIDGTGRGLWSRDVDAGRAMISLRPFDALSQREMSALSRAAGAYGRFHAMPAAIAL